MKIIELLIKYIKMKKYSRMFQAGLMMLFMLVLASCSGPKSELTAVPNDAGFVMVVDGKVLNEKSGVGDITQTDIYKKALNSFNDEEMADFKQFEYLLKDSKESGLGINDEFILFVKMENGEPIIGMNFKVLDKSKVDALFEKVIAKEEDGVKIINEDGLSILKATNKEAVIIWNEKQLLVYAQVESGSETILASAKALMSQSASESISSNTTYTDFYAKKKDVSFWLNYDLFLKNMAPAQQMMIMSQMPFSMEGTYFYGYVDFQKGQVVTEYESIMNDEMKDWMKKYQIMNDNFDTDVLKMLPKNSYANMEFSFSLINYYHLFMDMFKEKQVDTEVYTARVEKEIGMTIDELLESFSGEMAITMHGLEMKEKTSMSYGIDEETGEFKMEEKTSMQPEVKYSAVIKFENDKVWNLIETRAADLGIQKTGDVYSVAQAGVSFTYINNIMVITNDSVLMADLIANGSVEPNLKSTDVASYLDQFPVYLEVDMNLDNYKEELVEMLKGQGNVMTPELMKNLNIFSRFQVIATSQTSAKFVLQLKDDSKNSLEVIINDASKAIGELSQN